jgi:HEAT repeat protein
LTDDVDRLIQRLSHESLSLRVTAARELGATGASARAAVPALTAALLDAQWLVAAVAAEALGRIGIAALTAVPALVETLGHHDWRVRKSAVQALRDLPDIDSDAVSAIEEHSRRDRSPEVRTACKAALDRCRTTLASSPRAQVAPLLPPGPLVRLIS